MQTIRGLSSEDTITPIEKGWSDDQKFLIEAKDGTKRLLRLSDGTCYEKKRQEYDLIFKAAQLGIPMSQPIDFGLCENNTKVYMLLSWIEGNDAEEALPVLSAQQQYQLGLKAGQLLKQIHTIPAPEHQEDWEKRFNDKIDRKLHEYQACPIHYENDAYILKYIEQNRFLLRNRPQTFQHGDYHVGNMILSKNSTLSIIDFNRFDFGDPWEEFNRIVWCRACSKPFATGRINGYFDSNVPEDFFRLLALYISSNTLSSIPWAIPFGQQEVDVMKKQAQQVLEDFDCMKNPVPLWYLGQHPTF